MSSNLTQVRVNPSSSQTLIGLTHSSVPFPFDAGLICFSQRTKMLIDTDTLFVVIALYVTSNTIPLRQRRLLARTPAVIYSSDESVSCIFDFHALLGVMQACI